MSDDSSSDMSIDHQSLNDHQEYKKNSKTARFLASSLYDGVEDGNLCQLTTLLINKGADPNFILPENGLAPIHLAAGLEDVQFGCEATKLFLCHGGDPNVRSSDDGLTPVHIASLWGRTSVLKLLLDNGGDPWLFDFNKKNAFCHAHEQGQWEVFQMLESFKNKMIDDKPDVITKGKRYKLRLECIKVFNKDICAEYKAVPFPSKCCSTQTPVGKFKKKISSVITPSSCNCKQKTTVDLVKNNESLSTASPHDINVNVIRNSNFTDNEFDIKFNVGPSSKELQALEMVRKHRQSITVFEYVPESAYHGDNENISVNYSETSSLAGSVTSLVRGSVFADVKSKIKLFYKNVSSNNKNKDCSWRLNLIQKRKEKNKLKNDAEHSFKGSSCDNIILSNKNKEICKETLSDITNYNGTQISIDTDNWNDSFSDCKLDRDILESKTSVSKKSNPSLWKFKFNGKNKKANSLKNFDGDSFHRFEDVTDKCDFDVLSNKESNKPDVKNEVFSNEDKISENYGKCVCEGIRKDLLQRIDPFKEGNCCKNEIGFSFNNENSGENLSDSLLIYGDKRDVGFNFDKPLLSIVSPGQNENLKSNDHEKNDYETNVRLCNHKDCIETIMKPRTNYSSYGDPSCSKDERSIFNKFYESSILTEDESGNKNKCVSSLKEFSQNYNFSSINRNEPSDTDVFHTCESSMDHLKENSDYVRNFINTSKNDSEQIFSSTLSRHHTEDILVYENDTHETSDKSNIYKESDDDLNTAFHGSNLINASTPEKVSFVENENSDSVSDILEFSEASLHENCGASAINSNVNNSNITHDNNSLPDIYNALMDSGPSTSYNNLEIVPKIKIPVDLSSCSEEKMPKLDCTNFLGSTGRKWTCAELISSDEENDVSIIEEYLYTDEDDGIELVEERHIPVRCSKNKIENVKDNKQLQDYNKKLPEFKKRSVTTTETESDSPLSSVDTAYETDDLRRELKEFGFITGPITGGTKRVYLRHLKRARRKPIKTYCPTSQKPEYSPELERLLRMENKDLLGNWCHLETEMSEPFQTPDPNKRWREGVAKTSFTYLLLDPRVTQDLPCRANSLSQKERLTCFLEAIFYVGRGKRARPYSHLTEALAVWNNWKQDSSKKVNRIIEIWESGLGVVCLHVFQNVIPVEAMTREAAMIDALGLHVLSNERVGDYYGTASIWKARQRQQLGVVLLVRALNVFIGEGERQIRPLDIKP